MTLRRPYKPPTIGMPPAPAAGLTGVAFAIYTLDPQIGEASYDLKQRFAIDDDALAGPYRSSSWLYDLQVLRVAAVYSVLFERYTQESRTERGDFDRKGARCRQKLDDAISRIQLRWGPYGNSAEPTAIFSTRLSR